MAKKTKLPTDTNRRAKAIVDLMTGDEMELTEHEKLKAAAAALGRAGGLKGGKARAAKLSDKEKTEIAKKAAAARWGSKK